MSDTFREGARLGDPADTCPRCNGHVEFAYDFKKFGSHSLRVCLACMTVFVDGKDACPLAYTPPR